MNESHDPDDWQDDGEPHWFARAVAFGVVYAVYCGLIFTHCAR